MSMCDFEAIGEVVSEKKIFEDFPKIEPKNSLKKSKKSLKHDPFEQNWYRPTQGTSPPSVKRIWTPVWEKKTKM